MSSNIRCVVCPLELSYIRYTSESIQEHFKIEHPRALGLGGDVPDEPPAPVVPLALNEETPVVEAISQVSFGSIQTPVVDAILDVSLGSIEENSAVAGGGGHILCDWCPQRFQNLSSSTNHIRLMHPAYFYSRDIIGTPVVSPADDALLPSSASSSASAAAAGPASSDSDDYEIFYHVMSI